MEPAGIIDALLRRRKPQPAAEVSPSDDDLRALGCSFVATATWPCDQHSTTALDVNRQIVAKRDLPVVLFGGGRKVFVPYHDRAVKFVEFRCAA